MAVEQYPGPINLGNPEETSIKKLAMKIADITGTSNELRMMPLPTDDPVRRQPNITLAKNLLKWEPESSIDKGLKKTVEYFEKTFIVME